MSSSKAIVSDTDDSTAAVEPERSVGGRAPWSRRLGFDRFSGVYCWLLLVIGFSLWLPDIFPTSTTAHSIGNNLAVTAILAMSTIVPLACGLFDISIAATMGVAAVLVIFLQNDGMNSMLAIAVTVLVGLLVGAANGFLVVSLGVSSFVATLGMSSVLAAIALATTSGVHLVADPSSRFVLVGQGTFAGVPNPVWFALIVAAVLYYLTEWTRTGRYLYAVGSNLEAARLAGIRVDRIKFASLLASGGIAAVAGIVLAAQLGSSNADNGPLYLLPAFSAVLLGATQIKTNGRVNVPGTLVAVLLLGTGIYGLQLAGAPTYVTPLFNGVALIIAVAFSVRANQKTG